MRRKCGMSIILAIFLVEDHPGHDYVAPIVEAGLRGDYVPVMLDITPIRAYWITH